MPTAQVRNPSLQELGGVDHLAINNRNFAAEWYDAVGGLGFIGATTVPLATERHNAAPTLFSMSSNILTLSEAGVYLFNFAVTASQGGTSEIIWSAYLEEDPATGVFAAVPATECIDTFFSFRGTAVNSVLLRAFQNYRYRLRVIRYGGTEQPTLVQNGSRLAVTCLFQNN